MLNGQNGADRARTGNPHVANVVLSQLSYGPVIGDVCIYSACASSSRCGASMMTRLRATFANHFFICTYDKMLHMLHIFKSFKIDLRYKIINSNGLYTIFCNLAIL